MTLIVCEAQDDNAQWQTNDHFQLWSPVRAMAIYVKLQLPLRTYQVRMIDSGEADTWRYQQGQWQQNNKHNFFNGDLMAALWKRCFKRIHDSMTGLYSTGLYINTNKTADQNKEEIQRGYTIPWQHEEALYWLEKLRNWQEKYNPIEKPTSCTTLLAKHTRDLKSSTQLEQMGDICFYFVTLRPATMRIRSSRYPMRHYSPSGISFYSRLKIALLRKATHWITVSD